MDDREILKTELMKLLDDIPLERLKALYIKALVASSAKVVNPDCRQGTEPREEIIAWIVEQLRELPFPAILTDNGSEFKRVQDLEQTWDGQHRTQIFYCDPQASWQKPHIEKNHEFIRYVIRKGKSLNPYNQKDMVPLLLSTSWMMVSLSSRFITITGMESKPAS